MLFFCVREIVVIIVHTILYLIFVFCQRKAKKYKYNHFTFFFSKRRARPIFPACWVISCCPPARGTERAAPLKKAKKLPRKGAKRGVGRGRGGVLIAREACVDQRETCRGWCRTKSDSVTVRRWSLNVTPPRPPPPPSPPPAETDT